MGMTKKAVVTGGAGFIGSHIVDELLAHDYEVTVLDNLHTGRKENVSHMLSHIEFVEGDIRDYDLLRQTFSHADIVFHQAALPSVPRSIETPFESHTSNALGALTVFVAARDAGVRRVVFASSSSVYGDSAESPKVETMPYNPLSPYAVQKVTQEMYARVFAKLHGLETVGLRYFNVFGPRQNPHSKYAAVIPLFITAILRGEQPVIYGDGSVSRDFTYVKNVAYANILAAEADHVSGEVFNVACGGEISLNELVRMINTLTDSDIMPQYASGRPGDISRSCADISKAHNMLGYKVVVPVESGLEEVVEYLRSKVEKA